MFPGVFRAEFLVSPTWTRNGANRNVASKSNASLLASIPGHMFMGSTVSTLYSHAHGFRGWGDEVKKGGELQAFF